LFWLERFHDISKARQLVPDLHGAKQACEPIANKIDEPGNVTILWIDFLNRTNRRRSENFFKGIEMMIGQITRFFEKGLETFVF